MTPYRIHDMCAPLLAVGKRRDTIVPLYTQFSALWFAYPLFGNFACMNVLDIIKREHREVSALFDEAKKCDPGDKQIHDLAREIEQKLSTHLSIEERLFYSQLRDRAEEQDERVEMFEAYTEHAAARSLMEMLKSGRKPDEKFKAELQVLGENVAHHVKEEESTVFGIAREYLDKEELDEIGAAWEKAKARKKSVRGTTAAPKAKARR
jgi:hemerythrin-like domain-containing protein